jgi:adenylate cyclase
MALVFVAIVLIIAGLSRPVENMFRDLLTSTASPFLDPGRNIVIVAVTEETLSEFSYRSPIDRGFLGDLLEHIGRAGPRAIGIDILFDQPTEIIKDERLVRILRTASVPIVIASAEAADGLTQQQASYLQDFATDVPRGLAVLSRDPVDGVVRHLFPGRESDGAWLPGFAQAVAIAGGARPRDVGTDMVYFRTQHATPYEFSVYPAHTALLLPPQWFKGKFVLIGADLPLEDRHLTPFAKLNGVKAGTLPGVIIHAHGLAQTLTGAHTERIGMLPIGLLLVSVASIAGWLAWRPLSVLVKPLVLFVMIGAILTVATLLYWQFGMLVPVIWPSVLVAGLFALFAVLAWHRDNTERRFVRNAFAQYVSPAVVDTVLKNPLGLRLGGERRSITCVFTDLEGFTALSENQPPERVAALLNAYLDQLCDLFVMHGATIDKVIGDSVVGFFGAPAAQDDQAERAVSLVLELDTVAENFRHRMKEEGVQIGITRIGVHSGPAIVGNFGGQRFFDYTAVGDTVNTASRLEGANKHLGTRICVSINIVDSAPSQLYRPTAVLHLKGKTRGIEVFEPLKLDAPALAYIEEYRTAYRLMTSQLSEAVEAFKNLTVRYPDDGLAAFHHARLASGALGAEVYLGTK